MACNSIFLPHLNYRTGLWSACSAANICKLETLQHKGLKAMLNLPFRTLSVELYQWFSIHKPLEIREIQNCINMHKLINGLLPPANLMHYPARSSLAMCSLALGLIPTVPGIIYIPTHRLVSSKRTFLATMPRAWNKLPLDIRNEFYITVFKLKLKQHVLSKRSA